MSTTRTNPAFPGQSMTAREQPSASPIGHAWGSTRFAFAHLNLYRNPFGEWTRQERAELAVVDVQPLLQHLSQGRAALQVIGEQGRGKTTHLLALHQQFPQAPFRYIAECEKHPKLPEPINGEPYFIDELQRLIHRRRRRLYGRGLTLIIGSHEDHKDELKGMGYRVRTIRPAEQLTPEKLHALLSKRILHCRRSPGRVPRITPETIHRLMEQFGSDVRAMEANLYDIFQQLREPVDV